MIGIIHYCHDNKISDRDLKPQNFLLVMLIDFGLSFKWQKSMREQVEKRYGKDLLVGTAYYIAPQIFQGSYDQRCDIWSLGIILFMLTTGEPPVSGLTHDQVMSNVRSGKLNLSVLKQKKLSKALVELIFSILRPQESRISVKDILSHPWMTTQPHKRQLSINFEKIRSYSKFSKFKVVLLNYIASQLSQKDIRALGKVFMQIDENKDGYLTVQELSKYMATQQRQQFGDLRQIIQHMDVDHNGRLAYNEFISACLSKAAANNRDYLAFAFRYFDLKRDGLISRQELLSFLNHTKENFRKMRFSSTSFYKKATATTMDIQTFKSF